MASAQRDLPSDEAWKFDGRVATANLVARTPGTGVPATPRGAPWFPKNRVKVPMINTLGTTGLPTENQKYPPLAPRFETIPPIPATETQQIMKPALWLLRDVSRLPSLRFLTEHPFPSRASPAWNAFSTTTIANSEAGTTTALPARRKRQRLALIGTTKPNWNASASRLLPGWIPECAVSPIVRFLTLLAKP